MNIRKNVPELEAMDWDADVDKKAKVMAENKRRRTEQAMANLSKIIDAIAEEHPAETLELLALVCFVEPKDVNKHLMGEYLESITEMITDQAVVGFFTSLAKLGQMRI
jgi:Mlc titration factor MtfA (ptsG expression regulator)